MKIFIDLIIKNELDQFTVRVR